MASRKYGPLNGMNRFREMPVAASQYFCHEGVNFFDIDSSGHVTLLETADGSIAGWADCPGGRGNTTNTSDLYWLSSATAGASKVQCVLLEEGASFLLRADATPTQAQVGDCCDITAANSATASYVNIGTSSTDVLIIEDLGSNHGGPAASVVVRMNPEESFNPTS